MKGRVYRTAQLGNNSRDTFRGHAEKGAGVPWIAAAVAFALAAGIWLQTMRDMPLESHRGPLPTLTAEEARIASRLREHVSYLADRVGERHLWRYEALSAAAEYIRPLLPGI